MEKEIKRKKPFNVGLLIYLVLIIYVLIYVITYFSRDNIPRVEALSGTIIESERFEGIITREEKVVLSEQEGYVNRFFRNGERVANNAIMATVSEQNRQRAQEITQLDQNELTLLNEELFEYKRNYSDTHYNELYVLKSTLDNKLLEFNFVVEDIGEESDTNIIRSLESGLISYELDGLENVTVDDIDNIDIDGLSSRIEQQQLLKEYIEIGEPLYRIIQSQTWQVTFPITQSLENYIENKSSLTIKDVHSNMALTGQIIDYDDERIVLEFNRYVNDYMNQRFLEFEIIYEEVEGIKIPNSAIVEKTFFQIPKEYVTRSGNQSGLMKVSYLDDGTESVEFIPFYMNYRDEDYYYIRDSVVHENDLIRKPNDTETYRISTSVQLEGVYDSVRGYANFKLIEKVYSNDMYSVVKRDTSYGIRLYDHIIIDGSQVEENQIIL
ncbi:HlyD family efflux transporter periplasmic adaptor subunit [Natranaerovirga hydrolytica]|uniref:HlyD family efflux transporter periplasmic adaptor subunit n=1 Tax=Natranaerovirga hydrolytica TaxID=680378 RepID=UPI001045FA7E|nr:HlyD family efflux transporter periplasmic adaptor subunit [Natranaerovirga hydrolytica]